MHLGPNLNNPLYLYEYSRIIIHIYETDKVNEYLGIKRVLTQETKNSEEDHRQLDCFLKQK